MEVTLTLDPASLDSTLAALAKVARKVSPEKRLVAFKLGAIYFASALESNAPVMNDRQVNRRYSTAKVVNKIRAPKGKGTVVAEYHRGNLARAQEILKLRRQKYTVSVGTKVRRGRSAKGVFKGTRVDGYYMKMVHDGTRHSVPKPWVEKSFNQGKGIATKVIANELKKIVES